MEQKQQKGAIDNTGGFGGRNREMRSSRCSIDQVRDKEAGHGKIERTSRAGTTTANQEAVDVGGPGAGQLPGRGLAKEVDRDRKGIGNGKRSGVGEDGQRSGRGGSVRSRKGSGAASEAVRHIQRGEGRGCRRERC